MIVFNPGKMKRMLTRAIVLTMLVIASSVVSCPSAFAQKPAGKAQTEAKASADTAAANTAPASQGADAQAADTAADAADDASLAALGSDDSGMPAEESQGFYKSLKTKFIEGNAGFMSFVALALVLGLAFCIERIIYLSLSEINAKKFMADLCKKIEAGDIEGGKASLKVLARSSREDMKDYIVKTLESCFNMAGMKVETAGSYGGWDPNPQSEILNLLMKEYKELFGEDAIIQVDHAGLECSVILGKYPHLDVVSLGPTIRSPHTTTERALYATVEPFWTLLKKVMLDAPVK